MKTTEIISNDRASTVDEEKMAAENLVKHGGRERKSAYKKGEVITSPESLLVVN